MSKFLKVIAGAALLSATSAHAEMGLGREATPEEVAAWDIDIRPDGMGLPVGSGDVYTGEELWLENCSVCHGDFAEGTGRWPVLAGGFGTLEGDRPVKTVGSYWPYLSTVYDYIYRAMPFGNAQSLSHDDVYALTAYLLYSNDLVDDEFELSNENFTDVEMPNAPNFFMDDRMETEFPLFTVEACMEGCKDNVEITARAAVIDVTPDAAGGDLKAAVKPQQRPKKPPPRERRLSKKQWLKNPPLWTWLWSLKVKRISASVSLATKWVRARKTALVQF